MINSFLILLGKIIAFVSLKFNIGGGSTWPGHLALTFKKNFLKEIIKKNPRLKIILVAGTNGKTTSVALLKHVLNKLGFSVFTNQEGANLLSGITSSLIKNVNIFGYLKKQIAVWEVDEFSLPLVLDEVKPKAVVILNLFRDQLDRYGEVNTIGLKWEQALKKMDEKTTLIINGDDPYLYHLGGSIREQWLSSHSPASKVYFFGLPEKIMLIKNLPHDVDSIFCPRCQKRLSYKKITYSHLGIFFCLSCHFQQENIQRFEKEKIVYPLEGIYMKYNTHAIFLLLIKLFDLSAKKINAVVRDFSPHFGRQEIINYHHKKLILILSKNPASFNQALETAKTLINNKKTNFLIILNNQIPDGRDVSWIWDVDFKKILSIIDKVFVTGDRAYDMALRLKYDFLSPKKIIVFESLKKAINQAVNSTKINQPLVIFPNYSAMLMIRKLLIGKKFI